MFYVLRDCPIALKDENLFYHLPTSRMFYIFPVLLFRYLSSERLKIEIFLIFHPLLK
jgi:hypothetical protein